MIILHRSASVAPGKGGPAMAFAKDVAEYGKSKYKLDMDVLLPIGGNPQRVAWLVRYKDLAAMDAVTAKLLVDTKYQEMVVKGAGNWIPGSTVDSIWRTI